MRFKPRFFPACSLSDYFILRQALLSEPLAYKRRNPKAVVNDNCETLPQYETSVSLCKQETFRLLKL